MMAVSSTITMASPYLDHCVIVEDVDDDESDADGMDVEPEEEFDEDAFMMDLFE